MSELEKFRTRWYRWLGQMTRCDKDTWVELLDCNWSIWVSQVSEKHNLGLDPFAVDSATCEMVKLRYTKAIRAADMADLFKLDNLFCTDLIRRKGW